MIIHVLKAFDFIKIKYPPPSKNLNSLLYIVPMLLAFLFCIFFGVIDQAATDPKGVNVFNHRAFDNISTFVQILPGFYIGALAAIASYMHPGMDNMITAPTPYLKETLTSGSRQSKLSRRRYLTLMFGYLSAISIISAIFIFFVRLAYDVEIFKVSSFIYNCIYYPLLFCFFTIFCQMVLITLFGIYYLADRMHRQ